MKLLSLATICILISTCIEARTFLFPIPQEVEWLGTKTLLSNDFRFMGIENKYVQSAANRYLSLIKRERWRAVQVTTDNCTVVLTKKKLKGIHFQVEDNSAKLDMGIDESYSLIVPELGGYATLKAKTWVGALRGLETFSQLVLEDDDDDDHQLVVHTVNITDYPTYGHRGILLDTSRHFFSVNSILRVLDAQAYNKMNVLHWHATDSQSWPLYFRSHPELSEKGAYSSKEVYSPSDVKKIISYAESLGVRVILEIDMPAHTASIGESHPNLILCGNEFWADYAAEPPAGQLNPILNATYDLIHDLILEGTKIFPDTLFHSGGDEINTACWELDQGIKNYVKTHRLSSTKEIWFEFTKNILHFITSKAKKRPIIWEDSIKDGGSYSNDTVVQAWIKPPGTYTKLGYDVIVSNYDYFYLDCGHGGWVGEDERYISSSQTETSDDVFNYGGSGGSWCAPFKTWQRIYSFDMTHGIEKSHGGKVLGGETAAWAEQIDENVIDGRLWPRSAAAAEIYWSGSYDTKAKRRTVKTVSERFYDWNYRLQARGIQAEPVQPKYCHQHPGACNLNNPKA
ncbi:glycoside hydrolase superfamily [Cokeromyces recurvatus]|uniref:glycoside hydrolase superfamily n=1 Tax=Cokeromyces recurvatus TaxID=90255 RepID=UPI00221F1178|nr:glycoside hydrolase superfamily [Cokeromyces recurvatus]KAI7900400.1 glycoside hydrolase superfamily [Cokeromyces recurvatus]